MCERMCTDINHQIKYIKKRFENILIVIFFFFHSMTDYRKKVSQEQ